MDPEFHFDAASSDEETEFEPPKLESKEAQSPWEFAAYSESVAEEHARRNTTSVDDKISKALQGRQVYSAESDEGDDDEEGAADDLDDLPIDEVSPLALLWIVLGCFLILITYFLKFYYL